MRLSDLAQFNPIIIQCHDNPDADAIGSGYALYCYFKSLGKDVRLVYGGVNPIRKSNLLLFVKHLHIPIEHITSPELNILGGPVKGLLLTVDCQYGSGNVSRFAAENIAVIDHHQQEIGETKLLEIRANLGSCATLVWRMLLDEGYEITDEEGVGTALYYGLFTDTNQLAELSNPLDLDLMDQIPKDQALITLLRNSNITMDELELASVALLRYSYNEEHKFAVVHAHPCDQNVLGLISDFMLQVDKVTTCVAFNRTEDGVRLSVRSCIKEVNAKDLAQFLTEGIGAGGGHYVKSGGSIKRSLYDSKYPNLHYDAYINMRMADYFGSFDIVDAQVYEADVRKMHRFTKKHFQKGYIKATDVLPEGSRFTVRSSEGDFPFVAEKDLYIMIGVRGEVYPIREEKFKKYYKTSRAKYVFEECVVDKSYVPMMKDNATGVKYNLTELAHLAKAVEKEHVFARKLERSTKVFTEWNKNSYVLGHPGDYLVVKEDDLKDVYVVSGETFGLCYEKEKTTRKTTKK